MLALTNRRTIPSRCCVTTELKASAERRRRGVPWRRLLLPHAEHSHVNRLSETPAAATSHPFTLLPLQICVTLEDNYNMHHNS